MKEDTAIQYKNKNVVIKELPQNGDNLSVFVRPGDEIDFGIAGFNPNSLEYRLVGGDIVVLFPNGGMMTFASMALMGYSATPPVFKFAGSGNSISLDEIISKIEEVNELPIESVNASFRIKVSDTEEQTGVMNKAQEAPQVIIIISEDSHRYDESYTQDETDFQSQMDTLNQRDNSLAVRQQVKQLFTGFFSVPGSDFDAYAPKEEMIPKPDEEMIPKPDEEMIPKPDEEMIPKPDEDMIPDNDFISPDEGFGDGFGNSYNEGNVEDAAKPVFYFKATAHQVRFSETTNDQGEVEVLGGGGSINGYKFDSVTNQYEPETIDMSARSEDMIIRAEDSKYFSNSLPSQTEIRTLTFQDLVVDQTVTVDGLMLTATGDISAADVAAAFADLAAGSNGSTKSDGTTPNTVSNATFSGQLSVNWSSEDTNDTTVAFTSKSTSNITVSSAAINAAAAPADVDIVSSQELESGYLSRVLRFEPQMPEGFYIDNFVINGLPSGVVIFDKDGNDIGSSGISRSQILFKDALGNIINYDDPNFLTNFKTAEFVVKYPETLVDPFNVSITSNYKLDTSYLETTDIASEQSYTNEYTFALKEIQSADDYVYNKADFTNAKDEGFIFAKEPNYNIIKDGSGDSVIYGGTVRDVVYDGLGNDTYYLSAGKDTLYGGGGTNYVYGDTYKTDTQSVLYADTDTLSYENVQSFSASEIKLLRTEGFISSDENQKLNGTYVNSDVDVNGNPLPNPLDVDMLAYYKGVYVDLDGVYVDGLNIDVNGDEVVDSNDKINVISKFANRVDKFTYDEDGNAIANTIGESITFTSINPNQAVEDLVVSSAGVSEVAAPQITTVATDGDATNAEKHAVTFSTMTTAQTVTIDGLTLTATGALTAAEVAAAFADLAAGSDGSTKSDGVTLNSVVNGTFTGTLSTDWSSGVVSDATVTFTSSSATGDVANIVVSSNGVSAIDAPADTVVSIVQGSEMATEQHTVLFKDLIAGQSVSVGGLTLTATAALSAAEIAAGFANLIVGSTSGNAVTNAQWSGTFSSDWTSGAQEGSGLANLQAIGYDILTDIENITGSNYNDTIYGNSAKNNLLSGLAGSDILDGRGGDNTLLGGDGYDTLYSGSGSETIDGGADTDVVSYENVTQGMIIRFDRPNGQDYDYAGYAVGDFAIKDKITNVEDVKGSNFADIIYGNGSTNFIESMDGDDRIFAGGGYDFIDGGSGSDWTTYLPSDYPEIGINANFMEQVQGITVDLNSTDFVLVRETTTNRLLDLLKSVEQISATDGNDVIYGNNSNTIDETFWGHDGNDTLWGRNGKDTIYGGDGDDTIRPGREVDASDGGDGIDYVQLYDDALQDQTQQILKFDDTGKIQYSTDTTNGVDGTWIDGYKTTDGLEQAINFEGIGLSNGQNVFYGNTEDNAIDAYNGNDTIYGLGGDDTINGGNDDDTLYGDDFVNTLTGNDTLIGGDGIDTMYGGKGNDIFHGSIRYGTNSDTDIYDGGEGEDTLDYSKTNHNYTMSATIGANGDGSVTFGGTANTANYNDTFTSIERFIASRGNDTIDASAANINMYLDGWSGTDAITGGTGDDTIVARSTNGENLNAGAGKDTLLLVQTVQFTAGNANLTNNITVAGFEMLDFGVNNNYYTRFNIDQWNANPFEEIIGGSSNRLFLHASNNNDTFNFGSSMATQDFSDFSGGVYIYGYNGDDTFNFENTTLGNNATFYLDGGSGTDTLKLGTNQTLSMTDNLFNTFEVFDLGSGSTLNVTALTNTGRSFYGNTKDFDDVDANADVNFIGASGNDIFYLDFSALRDEKLSVDGGDGIDRLEMRNFIENVDFTDSKYQDMFSNIEIIDTDNGSAYEIKFDAVNLANWIGDSSTLTLDIANNTQGTKVKINTFNGELSDFTLGSSYTIQVDQNEAFTLNVV